MIKLILISLVFASAFAHSLSQEIFWQKSYYNEIGSSTNFVCSASSKDGSLLIVSLQPKPPYHYFIMKIDSLGIKQWVKEIHSDNYLLDYFSLILTQNSDLSYSFIAGRNETLESEFEWFYKYDFSIDGDSLGLTMCNTSNSKYIKGIPYFLPNEDGSFTYTLHEQIASFFTGIYFVKIDKTGNVIYKEQVKDDSLAFKPISSPIKCNDGNYAALSILNYNDTILKNYYTTFVIFKVDTTYKEISRDSVISAYSNRVNDFYSTLDGGYAILSRASSCLSKISKENKLEWQTLLICDTLTNLYSLVENSNGDFFCVGTSTVYDKFGRTDTNKTKGWIVKVNKNGTIVWNQKFGKDSACNNIQSIRKLDNNNFYVSGTCQTMPVVYFFKDKERACADEKNQNECIIYPNPVTDILYFSKTDLKNKVRVYSLLGEKIIEENQCDRINISWLLPGIYIVDFNNKLYKIVKN